MKTFVLLTIGYKPPTPAIMDAWMHWFASIKEHIVDQVGLRNGHNVTPTSTTDLPMDQDAITGYLMITANTLDDALAIAKRCPMITSTRVYEVQTPPA